MYSPGNSFAASVNKIVAIGSDLVSPFDVYTDQPLACSVINPLAWIDT